MSNPIDSILAALGPDVTIERVYDNGKETTVAALRESLDAGVPAMDGGGPPSIEERYRAACSLPDVPAAMWREIAAGLRERADVIDFTRSDMLGARHADVLRSYALGCDHSVSLVEKAGR